MDEVHFRPFAVTLVPRWQNLKTLVSFGLSLESLEELEKPSEACPSLGVSI